MRQAQSAHLSALLSSRRPNAEERCQNAKSESTQNANEERFKMFLSTLRFGSRIVCRRKALRGVGEVEYE